MPGIPPPGPRPNYGYTAPRPPSNSPTWITQRREGRNGDGCSGCLMSLTGLILFVAAVGAVLLFAAAQ